MTIKRGLSQPSMILALTGSVACASNPGPEGSCALTIPTATEWNAYDEGDFTLQLPPDYSRVPVQGIDSRVGRWEAPDKHVGYDFGVYANPLRPTGLNAFPGLEVCQESDGRGAPRIIRYSPPDGGYAVSAHWPDLRQQGPGMIQSLTLEGVVQQADDQGELLAIIRSVRIEIPERERAEGGGEALSPEDEPSAGPRGPVGAGLSTGTPPPATSAKLLTAEGWGPIRIGMTRAEVVAAAGEDANPDAVGGPEPDVCDQFRPERAPEGMRVMIEGDRLTRITISAGTAITTERGLGVGDPAASIKEAYDAEAVISPHEYGSAPAEYITVWTTPPGGSDARGLVYEIGPDGRVAHIHAGGPSIQYVEGCL